jgi:hypothetical protein
MINKFIDPATHNTRKNELDPAERDVHVVPSGEVYTEPVLPTATNKLLAKIMSLKLLAPAEREVHVAKSVEENRTPEFPTTT